MNTKNPKESRRMVRESQNNQKKSQGIPNILESTRILKIPDNIKESINIPVIPKNPKSPKRPKQSRISKCPKNPNQIQKKYQEY